MTHHPHRRRTKTTNPNHRAMAFLPDLNHFSFRDYDEFYEPAEDTFLLVDALKDEADNGVFSSLAPLVCLEIGSGSGCVITFLAQLLQHDQPTRTAFFATDINEAAAQATKATALHNKVYNLEVVQTHLTDALHKRLEHKVDILLFNPPYVPTPSEEVGSRDITAAWAGGVDGREVIDRLLPRVPTLLSPAGLFYMIVVEDNKPADIAHLMGKWGFRAEIIRNTRAKNENLSVMKFSRHCSRNPQKGMSFQYSEPRLLAGSDDSTTKRGGLLAPLPWAKENEKQESHQDGGETLIEEGNRTGDHRFPIEEEETSCGKEKVSFDSDSSCILLPSNPQQQPDQQQSIGGPQSLTSALHANRLIFLTADDISKKQQGQEAGQQSIDSIGDHHPASADLECSLRPSIKGP